MLELKNIYKAFQDFSITDINLKVNPGDYYIILGKSGAGKTILIETIAGLLQPEKGSIWLNHTRITHQRIQHRSVGMVFQDYAIFPHKTVFQNIAYPLKKTGSKKKVKSAVMELAKKTGTEHILHRYPSTLSGGEIQRTVLARTLAMKPDILLLDEPLASLDVQYKRELQGLLRKLNREGQTIVHVTHDYEEALALANRVAVMHEGKIIQEGEVHEVFRNPRNQFTANFAGIRNFFTADVLPVPDASHKTAKINEDLHFYVPGDIPPNEKKIITIDATSIILSVHKIDSTALNNFPGTIKEVIPVARGLEIIIDIGVDLAAIITEKSYKSLSLAKGKQVWVSFKASAMRIFDY